MQLSSLFTPKQIKHLEAQFLENLKLCPINHQRWIQYKGLKGQDTNKIECKEVIRLKFASSQAGRIHFYLYLENTTDLGELDLLVFNTPIYDHFKTLKYKSL